jgi:RNA polymerase sigma-70 factor (ECF subfamily)
MRWTIAGTLTHTVDTLDNESLFRDRQLMKDVLRRLPESLEQVYKRYGTVLKSILMQVLHNEADADDVLQEVLLQVWDRAPSYCSEKGTLMAWLCTIARRRAIDRLRQQNAYRRATDRYEVSCQSSNGFNESHTVECEAFRDDLRSLLHQHLATLPPHQQRVIRLAFLEEKSQREISVLIEAPLGTVKTRIDLGIKKLSHALGRLRDKVE